MQSFEHALLFLSFLAYKQVSVDSPEWSNDFYNSSVCFLAPKVGKFSVTESMEEQLMMKL